MLDGALTLEKGNLAARDAKNDPTLAPHPLTRSFACMAVVSTPAGAAPAGRVGDSASALPSSTSDLEITVPELVLELPTE